MSVDPLIARLKKYETVPDKAVEFMKKRIYGGRSGNGVIKESGRARDTIHSEEIGKGVYQIGPEAYANSGFPYGRVIRSGRNGVAPKDPDKYLQFYWNQKGIYVRAKKVRPWSPNSDFIEETLKDIHDYISRF